MTHMKQGRHRLAKNPKLIAALDRSIADAGKITRRHCSNPSINKKAFDAAMRLISALHDIKQKEETKP